MELYGEKQLIEGMRTVRKNTIQIAEDIPEKDYGFRASPASRSVAETLVHIAVLSQLARVLHSQYYSRAMQTRANRYLPLE
jgi:hypothetical protein